LVESGGEKNGEEVFGWTKINSGGTPKKWGEKSRRNKGAGKDSTIRGWGDIGVKVKFYSPSNVFDAVRGEKGCEGSEKRTKGTRHMPKENKKYKTSTKVMMLKGPKEEEVLKKNINGTRRAAGNFRTTGGTVKEGTYGRGQEGKGGWWVFPTYSSTEGEDWRGGKGKEKGGKRLGKKLRCYRPGGKGREERKKRVDRFPVGISGRRLEGGKGMGKAGFSRGQGA